jgi:hypothetical protein
MTLFARILLWLAGLGFIAFGVAFLVDPLGTLRATGIAIDGDLAATELRAFYGGLEVGLGGFLIATDLIAGMRRTGLLLCSASYGSIGLARLLGIALAGAGTPFLWFALATELTFGVLGLVAWRRLRD